MLHLGAAAMLGCSLAGRGAAEVKLLRDPEMTEVQRAVDALWSAARADDSISVRQLSAGDTALTWVSRWRSAYPSFFDSTAGKLTAKHGYFIDSARTIAVVEFEVPWVTCKRPVYVGANDRYFARAKKIGDSWRIWRVWSEPC